MHWLAEADGDRLVLRRYGPWRSLDEVSWELELQRRLAEDGWRVPTPLAAPRRVGNHVWAVMSWVTGRARRARTDAARIDEQRSRGRLLGELHLAMQRHLDLGPRPGWPPLDQWLDSPDRGRSIDGVLADRTLVTVEASDALKQCADRARRWLADSDPSDASTVIVHGDCNPSNVLYTPDGQVSVIDFDDARLDLVGAEFAWAPRRHPWAMVDGFDEVVPISPQQRSDLAPLSWIAVLDAVRRETQWPRRPLPDSFATLVNFVNLTPRDAFER